MAGFVGVRGIGIPIPEEQIESLRTVVLKQIPFQDYPFLEVGERVRIRGGALDGVEGMLVQKGDRNLVISVEPIHRSLSISIPTLQNVERLKVINDLRNKWNLMLISKCSEKRKARLKKIEQDLKA